MSSESFGPMLRRFRRAAALTQEALAERAGLSAAAVAALEAGRRTAPRLSTVRLLADALDLSDDDRATLVDARGQRPDVVTVEGGLRAFVGRSAPLTELHGAFADRTRLVIVGGDAGIGKTRLVTEFVRRLPPRAATVLWGRCTAEPLGVYEPFVSVLRAAIAGRDVTTVSSELARVVPELRAQPVQADALVEKRLLFEAVASIVGGLGPTVLVIDDAHWADASTMALLSYLVGDSGLGDVTVIVTVRSVDLDADHAGQLAEISRRGVHRRIDLRGLEPSEVASLATAVAGGELAPELVDSIVRVADGNPFFVEELADHVAATGGDASTVPARVNDTLQQRFATLGPDAQALLSAGAVLGRRFDPYLAARLAAIEPQLVGAVDDALLSGLVVEGATGTLDFKHALVHASIEGSLSAVRTVEVHRAAAVTLAGQEHVAAEEVAAIARHWIAVAAVDRRAAPEAAHWSVRAGDAALEGAAHDEAVHRYEEAARLWTATTVEHADTLVRLGAALYSSGRIEESDAALRNALALAETLDDPALRARAALGLATPLRYGAIETDRVAALDAALQRLDAADTVLRTAVMAMLMRHLAFDRSPAVSERRAELAAGVRDAVTAPDASPELFLMLASARDSVPLDDPFELDDYSRRAIDIARPRRALHALANGWYQQAWSALERGHGDDWRTAVDAYGAVADELLVPFELGQSATMQAASALVEGRYDDAAKHTAAAQSRGVEAGNPNAEMVALGQMVVSGLDRGEAADYYAVMLAMVNDAPNVATFSAGLAVTAAMAGDHDYARRMLDDAAATGFDRIRIDSEWLGVTGLYCHACALVGAETHAAALYDLVRRTQALAVRLGPLTSWWGPIDHHLGALATVLGRREEAQARFTRAAEINQSMRAAPFAARTDIALARVYLGRGGEGDVERAGGLLQRAREAAERVGAYGIAREVDEVAPTPR